MFYFAFHWHFSERHQNIFMSNHQRLKDWSVEDLPREKLVKSGASSLSEVELIAILLRTGTKSLTAIDIARMLLSNSGNRLEDLCRCSISDLSKIKGLGPIKAITLIAAFELGRRRQLLPVQEKVQIRSSSDAAQYFQAQLSDLNHEEFWILMLNRSNKVLGKRVISKGGVSGTVVDPKIIFREALEARASGLILCHNHPSGNTKPSEADLQLTKKLKAAGNNIEIGILDHVIIAGTSFFSFADEGIL